MGGGGGRGGREPASGIGEVIPWTPSREFLPVQNPSGHGQLFAVPSSAALLFHSETSH